MVDERLPEEQQVQANAIAAARAASGWRGSYFGGVAFKYQRPVAEELLPAAGRLAARHTDFITTSGAGTGEHLKRKAGAEEGREERLRWEKREGRGK